MNVVKKLNRFREDCTATLQLQVAGLHSAYLANKACHARADRQATWALLMSMVLAAMLVPTFAHAGGPWDGVGEQALAIFTGGLSRTIATIAVIACGIAALAGKLSWDWAIKIILGIALIFGAAAVVDYFASAAGG